MSGVTSGDPTVVVKIHTQGVPTKEDLSRGGVGGSSSARMVDGSFSARWDLPVLEEGGPVRLASLVKGG